MNLLILILTYLNFIYLVLSNNLVENDYYFQLYQSENKEKPEEINLFNLKSEYYKINSTDGENMEIINKITSDTIPINSLSSIILFDDRFLIKTCFGPDKIVEIKDENGVIFTPKCEYFKRLKKNLENIKYCYSTPVKNHNRSNEYFIATYWVESSIIGDEEIYTHKYILFIPSTKEFGNVKTLDTQDNNFYPKDCINLFYKYIYCNIAPIFMLSKEYHFSIDSFILLADSPKINLVKVLGRFSNSIYHRIIGLSKETYLNIGKSGSYFLTEYHDSSSNKTRLMTSIYLNYYLTSYILRFEDLEIYNGINIEDEYIEPNLFNTLLTDKEELIITYVMKGGEGKNLLLLNKYDFRQSLQVQSKFDKYTLSNYISGDICENPKYMQTMFINSYINYEAKDKEIIEALPNEKYYKYQKDIGIVISCEKNNGDIEYETKKIVMPQCINKLNQINKIEKNNLFTFTPSKNRIVLDISNEPNLKSLRNVEIEFLDSYLYNNVFIILVIKEGNRQATIEHSTTIFNIEKIEFITTMNYQKGKKYQIPYRIKHKGFNGITSSYNLTSDICYFEFYYEGQENEEEIIGCNVEYCKECQNNNCIECNETFIGIKLDIINNECLCDVDNGFNKEPNITINMCVCKEGYSFLHNIKKCANDSELNNGSYCIIGQDKRSSIYIYDYIQSGMAIYYENDLPYCRKYKEQICNTQIWFKLGEYVFYSAKVNKCVYILYNNKIVMYSNRSECQYMYYDYKNCLNVDINNEEEYNNALDGAYEYFPDDEMNSLIINESNITFYILNQYTSKSFSSVELSPICIEKMKEEYNLPSLLVFIANIKYENYQSTQVEYSFYNSIPEFMNEELNISSCYDPEFLNINNTNNNISIFKRQLQFDIDNYFNNLTNINYSIGVDEIIVNVQVNWTEYEMQIIEEIYSKKGINVFNSSIDFYNDVCNTFTTPENISFIPGNIDMYLQNRRDIIYITVAICETGCVQIDYDKETKRAVCKCKLKVNTEGFQNVTFSPNEVDKKFKKKYILPNIRVMKCIFKKIWRWNSGQIFALILILAFALLYALRYLHVSDINKKNNNEDKIRKIYKWEEPIEELKQLLIIKKKVDKNDRSDSNKILDEHKNDTDNEIRLPPDEDDEGRIKFRIIPKNDIKNEETEKKEKEVKNQNKKKEKKKNK